MGAGRPRKPTSLHIVEGSASKRKHIRARLDTEPKFDTSILEPPEMLSERALERWEQIAPMLYRMGVLTVADEMSLVQLCEIWAEWKDTLDLVSEHGHVLVNQTRDGESMRVSPHSKVHADADRRLKAMLGEFGLTPASRSKIVAADVADPKSPGAKYGL